MNKQKIVIEIDKDEFRNACQSLLELGYEVVPGTVQANCSISAYNNDANFGSQRIRDVFVAFFKKI